MSLGSNPPQKSEISQKEYLKRYLSKDKGEKKKKKVKISSSSHIKRSVIIDDDLGLPNVASVEDEEYNLDYLGDEAPQIAGIIDERPPEIKAKESYGDKSKWKPLGDPGGYESLSNEHSMFNGQSNNEEVVMEIEVGLPASGIKRKYADENKSHRERILKNDDDDSDLSPPRSKNRNSEKEHISRRNKASYDSDASPPRKSRDERKSKRRGSDSDLSPPKKNKYDQRAKSYGIFIWSDYDISLPKKNKYDTAKRKEDDSDLSPPRKNKYDERARRKGSDSDLSPPRKNKHENRAKRKGSDSDLSPPRKYKHENRAKRKESDSDLSPPRKNKHENRAKRKGSDSDLSPPRKNKYENRTRRKGSDSDLSPPRKNKHENRTRRKGSDSDLSPPRKNKYENRTRRKGSDSDLSPPRNNKHENRTRRKGSDSDLSPPRKNRNESKTNKKESYKLSPPRRNKYEHRAKRNGSDSDLSPPRKNRNGSKAKREESDSDLSPPRKNRNKERAKRRDANSDISSSKNNPERNEKRTDKTLDGKKAGLQDAKNLKEELRKLKEQEDALFAKMQASVSGKTAAVVKRDKKTGKIRDIDKEKEEEVKKSAKVTERENKYARWGKGLKQIEEAEERVADYLHEMNKPLARYADDQDLDRMLKAREREGDPMLDYIKNKQAESIDVDNRGKPMYQGYYLPNRFNIRPGHRWDGVDRSNGYEKQWFEKQNARKALQEEAYKWSTSDM